METNYIQVKITHIINPNRFYFCDLSKPKVADALRDLEKTYPIRTEGSMPKKTMPLMKHDLVCYKQPTTGQKWIRATIDDLHTRRDAKHVAILWADDYGKSFSTLFPDNLVRLPYDHIFNQTLIVHAGLAVHPAMLNINSKTNRHEMFVQPKWCEVSLTFFKKCVQEASSLHFRKDADICDPEIAFGDLIAQKHSGEIYDIGAKLRELKFAIGKNESGERFLNVFNRSLAAVIERWEDNNKISSFDYNCDTLLVTEIAEPAAIEDEKIQEMTIDLIELSTALEKLSMVGKSVEKVDGWIKQTKAPQTAVLLMSADVFFY